MPRTAIAVWVTDVISDANIPKVQIICNSKLGINDIAISKVGGETALKERWNQAPCEVEVLLHS
ncbi:MAG: hypothetical protein HC916_02610 [Coleofasciculaceae cyanobacterium SM2_1_6]|nr:hypothetical protein [Coleofasciculaceae cyanobacterium SM2_1_6]